MKAKLLLIFVLVFCFVFRILITSYGTFAPDLMTYMDWGKRANEGGFSNFYNDWSDYLPGYIYVLWVLAKIKAAAPSITNELLYKLPSIITDIATMYLIYLVVRRLVNRRSAVIGAFIYGVTPAVFGNSSLWGQVDSFSTFFMVLAFYFLVEYICNKKYALFMSGAFLGLAIGMKPTGVFLVPLFAFWMAASYGFKKLFVLIVSAVIVFLLLFVPFAGGKNFPIFVIDRVQKSIVQHSATCLNTYNFWMVTTGCWKEASGKFLALSYRNWGLVMFVISYLGVLSILSKTKRRIESLPMASAIIFLSGFLFLTGMHERHVFPVFVFLAIAACLRKRLWLIYSVLAILAFINLWYAQAWFSKNLFGLYGPFYTNLFSLVMIFVWVYLMIDFVKGSKDETA